MKNCHLQKDKTIMGWIRAGEYPRYWNKVAKIADGCWNWTGSGRGHGYGGFTIGDDDVYAHRVSFMLFYGAIPPDRELDHLCRNRRCVNPSHLECVNHRENVLRGLAGSHNSIKTECVRGHGFTPENTYIKPNGTRQCRACRRSSDTKRRKQRGRP